MGRLRLRTLFLFNNEERQSIIESMQTLGILIVFVFGTVIGSFLNVVVLRYKTGRKITGRSGCFSCGKKLSALELVPLLSFFFQGGKCTGCSSKISIEYPLIEIFSAAIASASRKNEPIL